MWFVQALSEEHLILEVVLICYPSFKHLNHNYMSGLTVCDNFTPKGSCLRTFRAPYPLNYLD